MLAEMTKKRGRPRKVIDPEAGIHDGAAASASSKLPPLTKSTKQQSIRTAPTAGEKNQTKSKSKSRSKSTAKEAKELTSESEGKTKHTKIARSSSPKTKAKCETEALTPEIGVSETPARKESSKILQHIAALKSGESLKEKSATTATSLPPVPPPPESLIISIPQPTKTSIPESNPQLESYTIPSKQSSVMPSTFTPPSTCYQWLPDPPILTRSHQPYSRSLSSATRLQAQQEFYDRNTSDKMRSAKSLNRLATEASIPRAKQGLNPGGFPVSYKSATRRVTAIIVAAPVALCMSWFLYERLVLGVEQKKLAGDGKVVTRSVTT
ncbi:hypothetical protein E2P81_ATG02267 [Venturia nashicola]|uniref:Uncharacterized protein n=1 Tax=Venturia nashicola TaxID=86259 RepID=A0A4Z1PDR4_9PEZI|nr:hypothetical protein E6O75_ATG02325 [Venturia nashicola]TLD35964.1 hypothetical protein E2P81_ATG02267 [Venturia nashicola]